MKCPAIEGLNCGFLSALNNLKGNTIKLCIEPATQASSEGFKIRVDVRANDLVVNLEATTMLLQNF